MAKYTLDSLLKNTLGEKYTPEAVEIPLRRQSTKPVDEKLQAILSLSASLKTTLKTKITINRQYT